MISVWRTRKQKSFDGKSLKVSLLRSGNTVNCSFLEGGGLRARFALIRSDLPYVFHDLIRIPGKFLAVSILFYCFIQIICHVDDAKRDL